MIRPFDSLMLRVLLAPIVACLQLFALYILWHGHGSPGGGFQGGVLLGYSMILPLLVRGGAHTNIVISERAAIVLAAIGVLIFAVFGAWSLLSSRPPFDYGALPLPGAPATRRAFGILGVEIGVALAVAGAIVSLFYSLMFDERAP